MRETVVIPTYWSRKSTEGWKKGDAIYDHPTPVDKEGTLKRTLESLKNLNDKDFKLVILLCPTTIDIEKEAEEKVKDIINSVDMGIETFLFTPRSLRTIKSIFKSSDLKREIIDMMSLKGYSNVRNMCLFSAHILASDVVILIDDDEIIENKNFISMSKKYIGKRIYGEIIYGVAGYYLNKHDEYYDDVDMEPWMTYWDRFGSKAKAFDKIIGCEPRLKQTPFAFGGAMVIHKNLYQLIAFDPNITRGEDIDYLINSKMFGFNFFLDNKLSVKHLPPKKNHPVWQRFREDIYRFMYERAKLSSQYAVNNMTIVKPEDFDPYPGEFLKNDLEDKIYKTNVLLSLEYLAEGDMEASKETMKNIYISKYEAVKEKDPFTQYRHIQKKWQKIIDFTIQNRYQIRKIMESDNLSKQNIDAKEKQKNMSLEDKTNKIKSIKEFGIFTEEEIKEIAQITNIKFFNDNEMVFKEGEQDSKFYIIVDGCINIFKRNEKNEEISLATLCTGNFIGETAIATEKYYVNGKATEFLTVLSLEQSQIEEIVRSKPQMGMKFLQIFVEKLSYKLGKTNKLYADYLLQTSHLEDMS
ncbi:cyclic nucleotide-binding domain-containing protein [Senegalia massiliensis]|uniref:cyclic nucleotide-binding domain-containing protein n=1 Tax=Senegalia massiliensis TaxID=1720316 RepID=UPI00103255DD|nr:cyclic nucleotide-binding domain-containing protein [Senegalia massiliensis]